MIHGAYGVHRYLRMALESYIKSQYFGKSPILLSATEKKLDQEGVLYRNPHIESSPVYRTKYNGIRGSRIFPDWLKDYFQALSDAKLGVYPTPFSHQISALEAAYSGQDVFVATGTGSGKTECFMWPLVAKLANEARGNPDTWNMRGVRTIIMYPMNALVSDQLSRLRRLIGDPDHQFVKAFRDVCGQTARRPQFGMYTGRTPYPGLEPKKSEDKALANTYSEIFHYENDEQKRFLEKLISEGKLPAKENFDEFIEKLKNSTHIPDEEDAELVTRYEMQEFCPDILITNYSMLEYMLLRPREDKIWNDTKKWLDHDENNKLLFVIDEAHMYRGAAGGEVSFLIRRLFNRLGVDRNRVQFILTTASMPNRSDEDRISVMQFARELTAADDSHDFCYLTGEYDEKVNPNNFDIPSSKLRNAQLEDFEGDEPRRLEALNRFWKDIFSSPAPFPDYKQACGWLYQHLEDYSVFRKLFDLCRGNAVSLNELAKTIFPEEALEVGLHMVSILLAIAPLARSDKDRVLFPARMHMLFRGITGIYACTNPDCQNAHHAGGLQLGEIFLSDGVMTCPECNCTVYELFNDRRCGSLFFRGFVLKDDFEKKKRTYLWHQAGMVTDGTIQEIHLFIPDEEYDKQNKDKNISPCYLDVRSGFIDFSDDSLKGQLGIRKLYYMNFIAKGRPDVITFSSCPHCKHALSGRQLTSFSTRGNQSFFNLVKAQFLIQPGVPDKMGNRDRFPNEGRKVLLFSDSRQRAAKLARDMSETAEDAAARQVFMLAIERMEREAEEQSMDELYDFFARIAVEKHVHIFHDEQQKLFEDGGQALKRYNFRKKK